MPQASARSWHRPLLWLMVLIPATAWLFVQQAGQPVDPSNTALKAPGTADARSRQELANVLASEQVLLLAYHEAGEQATLAIDAEALASSCAALRRLAGVHEVRCLPARPDGLILVTVTLDTTAPAGVAEQVVSAARASTPGAMRFAATGLPLVEARLAGLVADERRSLVPLLGACLLGLACLIYRRTSLALAALLPALLSILWTSGIIAALGHPLDPVAALLDPLLLTIGVATSVHFVEHWRRAVGGGLDRVAAAEQARRQMQRPTLLATATTMVGLLSLANNEVPAVADFGIRAAFGIALLHAFVFLILPTWLARTGPQTVRVGAARTFAADWLLRLQRHRFAVGATAIAATTLAIAQLPRLHADNDPLTLLPRTEPCRVAYDDLAGRLGGVEAFHLLVAADSAATDLSRLLPFLATVQTMSQVAGIAGQPLRNEAGDLAVPVLLRPSGSHTRTRLFDDIERTAEVLGMPGLVAAGAAVQIARDSDRLVRNLLTSTAWTIALLGLGMCVGLGSWRLGLIGLVPTVLPCVWVYGVLAGVGRPVSVATGMIACTMLGLLVDNTVHFLHHYQRARRDHRRRAAVVASLSHVGRPMLLSSCLLTAGFGVAATSRVATTVEFSLLACSTIAAALLATSALLPLLLSTRQHRPTTSHAL